VTVATAADAVEAGALREFLVDHGVFCYVQGERHNALLGPVAGIAIALNVMVPRGDAVRALELIEAFHGAEPVEGEWDQAADDAEQAADEGTASPPARRSNLGKDRGRAALLAIVPSFGFGHFYAGAFGRGSILATTELVGLALLLGGLQPLGAALLALAVVTDLLGSASRVDAVNRELERRLEVCEEPQVPLLPAARVVPRKPTDR